MKVTIYIFTVIFLISMSSCIDEKQKDQENNENETPEIFQDKDLISDISSLKRGYSNLVEDLYNEIKEKNAELKDLKLKIGQLESDRIEASKEINKYFSNNQNYYSTANSYVQNIQDSILRNQIDSLVAKSEQDFYKKTDKLQKIRDSINQKEKELSDRYSALKIVLTIQNIENYQNNELPESNKINDLLKRYDNIIKNINKEIDN